MQRVSANNSQIIGDLVNNLYSTESLAERFYYYQQFICNLGFTAVSYSFEPKSSFKPDLTHPPVFEVSEQFPLEFLKSYQQDGWFQHDFVIREICEGDLQVKDWKQKEQSNDLDNNEKKLIRLAREQYGIKNAISIPTMHHSIGLAAASIISFADDRTFLQLKQKYLQTLINCTKVFNDIIMQHPSQLVSTFVYPKLPKVTPKERIVLRDLVNGLLIQKIGMQDGMSESAVSNHLLRLRKKFDVKNTPDLKHLLLTLNILDYL